ncbi:MAG: hypothetical protein AC479_08180 [miscellaneous Crenarchaeota group-6 archaeon AD8-1]|nr:MAG: hypothetical protein AC479_08180 [miscellaneous Crenarchaeota group-6 archaeon AD8-1]
MKTILSRSFAVLFVVLLSFSSIAIFRVKAQSFMTIIIDTDGSIDPINSSIKHIGNTYTLTKDIKGSIEVLSNDITIDGNGYTLQGDESSTGIDIKHKDEVTIKNLTITNHFIGIKLSALRLIPNFEPPHEVGHGTSISNNTILNNDIGVLGDADHDTIFSGNYIVDNRIGIDSSDSVRPVFSENQFLNNEESFLFNPSAYMDESNVVDGIPVATPTPTPTISPEPTPSPTPTSSPTSELEFPTTLVVASVVILGIGALGILTFYKKYKRRT